MGLMKVHYLLFGGLWYTGNTSLWHSEVGGPIPPRSTRRIMSLMRLMIPMGLMFFVETPFVF